VSDAKPSGYKVLLQKLDGVCSAIQVRIDQGSAWVALFCARQLDRLRRLKPLARYALMTVFVVFTGFIFLSAWQVGWNLFTGGNKGVKTRLTARTAPLIPTLKPTEVKVADLGCGRYNIYANPFVDQELVLNFDLLGYSRPTVLLFREGGQLPRMGIEISADRGELAARPLKTEVNGQTGGRELIRFEPGGEARQIRVKVRYIGPPVTSAACAFEEIGLFPSDAGLMKDHRSFFRYRPDSLAYGKLLPPLLFFVALACLLMLPIFGERYVLPGMLLVLGISLAVSTLTVRNIYSYRDIRYSMFVGQVQDAVGNNLNCGIHMGANLLEGNGPVLKKGWVPWHRMPGHAFFVAFAGIMTFSGTDQLALSVATVFMQMLFAAAANAFFFFAASRIMDMRVAGLICIIVAFLPNMYWWTLIEAILPGVVLLMAGVSCLYIEQYQKSPKMPLHYDVLLHSTFAFWFFLRPDIVPCWAIVSLVLHYRRFVRLFIPLLMFLGIGLAWGLFKYQYTKEWSMTTDSFGASAMAGLWEVPHKFKWQPSDGDYFAWIRASTQFRPDTAAANSFATREVFRFWLTFPGYMISLVWHELMTFVYQQSYFGWHVNYENVILLNHLRGNTIWVMLCTVVMALAIGYKRMQTFLLGALLFFNLPVFFLVYSSGGRFYNTACIVLFVASLPLLFDAGFYRRMRERPVTTSLVLAVFLAMAVGGTFLDERLIAWDSFRYATPFLDPAQSTLYKLK